MHLLLLCLLSALVLCVPNAGAAPPALELASLPRVLSPGQALPCRGLPLVRHRAPRGELGLRYSKPLRVHRAFAPRLRAFEALVIELARTHYGRAPRRIVHLGGYNCRRMRRYPNWVSEHALGNAIDIAGFDFGPLRRSDDKRAGVPRGSFQVRVRSHWKSQRGRDALHAAFLHGLTRRLIERRDIFSGVLGPGWPGHHDHLHLDAAPYRTVEVVFP